MNSISHKFNKFRVNYKIWLEGSDGNGILGEGKIVLLKQIAQNKSLSAASKVLNISYRKAWGDIKNAEFILGVKLIFRKRGGKCGGTSTLTDDAKKIIKAWNELHEKIDLNTESLIVEFKKFIKEK
ncbi:MAG: ModE family transcriptional regulator [Bacteroidetes bacterium CG02_land_8_20_14_3_00_31_25]|nr:LysR family transcriptional regulator [Bacteroidota bacterium]PIV58504.1 MAG: ModE family transcriptional regulator [Bacteroidetes bacterium CG02_land_8_20_14_3_00_31_25]PIX34282.1 MAG: ModE family transcriptional regulator [Bacteroidetes bacterium CG_4_8_14_3_um_filter_31_14]PIY04994.1 MAG: ModE family transcriptional regulator [Bacteroidetes bacterium CG_4_10_14_3_um_filter_31_20]